jgi:hypothetical protein
MAALSRHTLLHDKASEITLAASFAADVASDAALSRPGHRIAGVL